MAGVKHVIANGSEHTTAISNIEINALLSESTQQICKEGKNTIKR